MNTTTKTEALLIDTGDILLSGPNEWGIHHVILARSPLMPALEAMELGVVDKDTPVFYVNAIESSDVNHETAHPQVSTAFSGIGEGSAISAGWRSATYFVVAAPVTAELQLVGSQTEGCNTLKVFRPFNTAKILQHPLRADRGGPKLNTVAFEQAVVMLQNTSKQWSLKTALSALPNNITSGNAKMEVAAISDAKSSAALMDQIRRSWETPPICSSVAIAVWQCYFCCAVKVQAQADDVAIQDILRYMPVRCGLAMPSELVKSLGHCGWELVTHSEEISQRPVSDKVRPMGCCGGKLRR